MPKIRRAKAPHKSIRQIETAALKDLNGLLIRAKARIRTIVNESSPDPTQTALAGSQANLEKGLHHSSSDAVGVQDHQSQPEARTQDPSSERWARVFEWGEARRG